MSLQLTDEYGIPSDIFQVAQAMFPKGKPKSSQTIRLINFISINQYLCYLICKLLDRAIYPV
jgi:hypothetical protein